MKKVLFLLIAVIALSACKKSQEPATKDTKQASENPVFEKEAQYNGSVFVTFNGQEYETPSIRVKLSKENETEATLSMYKVKFVPQMPVTIDLDLPGVNYKTTGNSYTITGNNIIPTMGGNPFEKYIATDIKGTATKETLSFSLNFGQYPTRYEGQRITE